MSFRRSNLAQTAVVSVLGLAALALLGLVLAYWTWAWFGPRSEPRTQPSVEPVTRLDSANALFGRIQSSQAAVPTGLAIKLLGVVSATGGKPGYALLQVDAKRVLAVRAGEDIAPGVSLEKVLPDRVILMRTGTQETLGLPERRVSAPPSAPVAGK